MDALRAIDGWDAGAAAGVVRGGELVATHGRTGADVPWASVTKLLTGLALLVALEEGTVDLDEPAGPPGATLRHLLAHASGLPVDGTDPIARPGQRRIYSNAGIELAAQLVEERAEMPYGDYFVQAVARPLGLRGVLSGSPAHGYRGPLADVLALGRELLAPTLVAPETLAEATTVQFPELSGVLPGLGRMEPNDWGLTFELRDRKSPHWTGRGTRRAPSATSARAARSSGSIPRRRSPAVSSRAPVRRLGEGGVAGSERRCAGGGRRSWVRPPAS